MDNTRSTNRSGEASSKAIGLLALSTLSLGLASCSKSEAAPTPAPAKTDAARPDKARVDNENYTIEAKLAGPAKAGQDSTIEVTLTTKGEYHINKEYPYKFKLNDPPDGVKYPKPLLVRADGAFDQKSGKFKVPFTAAKTGKTTIGGTYSFSVCTEANCLMDKQTVDVDVDVK